MSPITDSPEGSDDYGCEVPLIESPDLASVQTTARGNAAYDANAMEVPPLIGHGQAAAYLSPRNFSANQNGSQDWSHHSKVPFRSSSVRKPHALRWVPPLPFSLTFLTLALPRPRYRQCLHGPFRPTTIKGWDCSMVPLIQASVTCESRCYQGGSAPGCLQAVYESSKI